MSAMRKVAGALSALGLLGFARCMKRTFIGSVKDLAWRLNTKLKPSPDDLPSPPPSLCFAVSANYDVKYFLRTGSQGADNIKSILERNGHPIEGFSSVFDFGCGCGRIARHWMQLQKTQITGTDINPRLVKWAQRYLPQGRFLTNGISSSLPFEDEEFDLVYAISVFTHLSEDLQKWWVRELTRVLRPDGLLLITVKGENWKVELNAEEQDRFDKGQMVVLEPESSGSNYCGAYHPPDYVQNFLAGELQVLEHDPCGSLDTRQDFYLMSKS